MENYNQQADLFLAATKTTFKCEFSHNGKHFDNDTTVRDIYNITLKRGNRSYSFQFGASIIDSQYYKDSIPNRTYTLDGKSRTGNYSITDIQKYMSAQKLQLVKGTPPKAYDVLTCLTKYDPDTFENFCSEYGYDTDSKSAEKTYNAVKDEYKNICALFTDEEIEKLAEIQ